MIEIAQNIKSVDVCDTEKKRLESKLILHNLRLVASVVNKFLKSMSRSLDSDIVPDLLQQGTLGLAHAIRKYEPERAYAFSTYATPWIKAYIRKHYLRSTMVYKVPPSVFYTANKIRAQDGSLEGVNYKKAWSKDDPLFMTSRVFGTMNPIRLDSYDEDFLSGIEDKIDRGHNQNGFSRIEEAFAIADLSNTEARLMTELYIYDSSLAAAARGLGMTECVAARHKRIALGKLRKSEIAAILVE